MTYFILNWAIEGPEHWYLSDAETVSGQHLRPITFTQGKYFDQLDSEQLVVKEYVAGPMTDYTDTVLGIPIVTKKVAELNSQLEPKAVQRIPVSVERLVSSTPVQFDEFEILNIVTLLDCVDPAQTIIEYYTEDYDPLRGQVKSLSNLTLFSRKVDGHHIFRLEMFHIHVIVSEQMKKELENNKLTGLWFVPINTSA